MFRDIVSILELIQNLRGHTPWQPALADLDLNRVGLSSPQRCLSSALLSGNHSTKYAFHRLSQKLKTKQKKNTLGIIICLVDSSQRMVKNWKLKRFVLRVVWNNLIDSMGKQKYIQNNAKIRYAVSCHLSASRIQADYSPEMQQSILTCKLFSCADLQYCRFCYLFYIQSLTGEQSSNW